MQVLISCHVRSEQIRLAAERLLQKLHGLPALQQLGPISAQVLQAAFGHAARDLCSPDPGDPASRSAFTDVIYISGLDSMESGSQGLRDSLHHGKFVPGLTRLAPELASKIDSCFHR